MGAPPGSPRAAAPTPPHAPHDASRLGPRARVASARAAGARRTRRARQTAARLAAAAAAPSFAGALAAPARSARFLRPLTDFPPPAPPVSTHCCFPRSVPGAATARAPGRRSRAPPCGPPPRRPAGVCARGAPSGAPRARAPSPQATPRPFRGAHHAHHRARAAGLRHYAGRQGTLARRAGRARGTAARPPSPARGPVLLCSEAGRGAGGGRGRGGARARARRRAAASAAFFCVSGGCRAARACNRVRLAPARRTPHSMRERGGEGGWVSRSSLARGFTRSPRSRTRTPPPKQSRQDSWPGRQTWGGPGSQLSVGRRARGARSRGRQAHARRGVAGERFDKGG